MTAPAKGAPKRRRGNRGQSIIGFTEAELGLFLALLFFGLSQMSRAGTPPLIKKTTPTIDSTALRNPRLMQLMALAQRLDSLERAVRAAFVRDSALASRLAQLQRERDSLSALRPGGIPGAAGTGVATAPATNTRLTAVERELALSQLSRNATAAALNLVSQRADSIRRQLDAIAPSVAQVVASGRPSSADPAAAAAALAAAAASTTADAASSTLPRDTMAVLRALAAAAAPPGIPGSGAGSGAASGAGRGPGVGGGNGGGTGAGSGPAVTRTAQVLLGAGIGGGSGTGAGTGPGRSRQTPTCIELKVDSGSVAEVLIEGADRYAVRGVSGSLQDLLTTMRPEIDSGKRYGCRHNVRIRSAQALAVDDYIFALNALLPYFNTELARPVGAR